VQATLLVMSHEDGQSWHPDLLSRAVQEAPSLSPSPLPPSPFPWGRATSWGTMAPSTRSGPALPRIEAPDALPCLVPKMAAQLPQAEFEEKFEHCDQYITRLQTGAAPLPSLSLPSPFFPRIPLQGFRSAATSGAASTP
jgi:hypothetical protein